MRRGRRPARSSAGCPATPSTSPATTSTFLRFEDLVADAHEQIAETPERALGVLDRALALWRGPVLAEFAAEPFAVAEAARLEERRAAAEEDRIEALLRLGRVDAAIADLGRLVDQAPLRDRRQRLLIAALYRAGRQPDALDAYRRHATRLAEEYGLDPSPELVRLHDAVLRHELPAGPLAVDLPTPRRVSGPPPTSLLGREEELARFGAVLDAAEQRRGAVVLVSGEPGIGKSRLVEAMLGAATDRGMLTALGRCYEGGGAPAFWPFVEVGRALAAQTHDEAGAAVDRLLRAVRPEGADHLRAGGEAVGTVVVDPATRFLVAEEITGALRDLAAHQPLVIALDDVYGADPDSLEALVRVAASLASLPAVVVATLRTADLPHDHPLAAALGELGRLPHVTRIAPRGLTIAETRTLLAVEAGLDADLELAERVHRRTDGNPFFTVELARLIGGERTDLDREVPAGVRDVLRLRLSRLPEEIQAVLRVAAICGRSFARDVVAGVLRASEAETLDHLEIAIASQLIGEEPDPGSYRFAHVLIQQAIADGMTALRRAHLHEAVAAVLAPRAAQQPDLWVEVAHHAVEATAVTSPESAVEPLAMAALHAVAVNAHELGQQLIERRLALVGTLPPGPPRDAAELQAQVDLCTVLPITSGWHTERLVDAARRVHALGSAVGDLDAVMQGLCGQAANSTVSGRYDRSIAIGVEQQAVADRSGRPDHHFLVHHSLSMVEMFRGNLSRSLEHFVTADAWAAQADPDDAGELRVPPDSLSGVAHVASLWSLALWLTGSPDEADRQLERAHRVAARTQHLQSVAVVWLSDLIVHYLADDPDRVLAGDRQRRVDVAALRAPLMDALLAVPVAWATAARGEVAGVTTLRRLVDELTASGALIFGGLYRGALADACLRVGDPVAALAAADEALGLVEELGECMWQAEIERLRGVALARLDRRSEAAAAIAGAGATARGQGAVALLARIAAAAAEIGAPTPV